MCLEKEVVGVTAKIQRRIGLTFSSIATLRDFQTNSQTAITQAMPIPPIKTTKTPPTFAKPNSFAAELDLEASS